MRGAYILAALALTFLLLLASRSLWRPPSPSISAPNTTSPPSLAPHASQAARPASPPSLNPGALLVATLPDASQRFYRLENATWRPVRAGAPLTVVLTCLAGSNETFFYARLVGPALVVGAVRSLGGARYALEWRALDAGAYRPELLLAFLSVDQAYPSGSVAHRGCLCAPLAGALPTLVVLPDAPRPPAAAAPSPAPLCAPGTWPDGRWLVPSPGVYTWAPLGCRLHHFAPPDLAACLAARRPLLVGDSHLRVLGEALNHSAVTWHAVKGVCNVTRPPAYFTDLTVVPARRPVLREWLESAAGRAALGAAGAVYFEAGQWDLRDWSVAQFVADVADALAAWPPPPPGQRRLLVTAPAFSYRHARFGVREYRTLEKLDEANAAVARLFAAAGWERADWWALSRPLHRATCDTHHFLCPHAPHAPPSPVGRAMLDTFAHQLCSA